MKYDIFILFLDSWYIWEVILLIQIETYHYNEQWIVNMLYEHGT